MDDALAGRFKRCNPELCLGEGVNRRPKRNNRIYLSSFCLLKANLIFSHRSRPPLRDFFQKTATDGPQVPRVAFDIRLFWELVYRLAYNDDIAAGQLAVFQRRSEPDWQ
jgi:hypothetical protein